MEMYLPEILQVATCHHVVMAPNRWFISDDEVLDTILEWPSFPELPEYVMHACFKLKDMYNCKTAIYCHTILQNILYWTWTKRHICGKLLEWLVEVYDTHIIEGEHTPHMSCTDS